MAEKLNLSKLEFLWLLQKDFCGLFFYIMIYIWLIMATYIVTYDLRNEESSASYQKLLELIKEGGIWARLGGSSYLIESDFSPVELRDKYRNALDKDDKLYVGEVTAPAAWIGYNNEVTDWIKDKLK